VWHCQTAVSFLTVFSLVENDLQKYVLQGYGSSANVQEYLKNCIPQKVDMKQVPYW
jgi:hypothetical protein